MQQKPRLVLFSILLGVSLLASSVGYSAWHSNSQKLRALIARVGSAEYQKQDFGDKPDRIRILNEFQYEDVPYLSPATPGELKILEVDGKNRYRFRIQEWRSFYMFTFFVTAIAVFLFLKSISAVLAFANERAAALGVPANFPTTSKLIGFLFIPFFNFYWIFRFWSVGRDIHRIGGTTPEPDLSVALGCCSIAWFLCQYVLTIRVPLLGGSLACLAAMGLTAMMVIWSRQAQSVLAKLAEQ